MFKKEYYFSKIAEISSKKTTNNVLYLLSFAESIVFPIPVDPLLAACIIAKPKKVFYITIFTVLILKKWLHSCTARLDKK